MNDSQCTEMSTAIKSRDRIFAAIMRENSGSPRANVEIVSSSDVPGGNNYLSLRKVAVNVGGTGHLVLDKIPVAPRQGRHDMNVRELWLYEKVFRDSRFDFVPEFYGSRVEGAVMQWVFRFIEGVHPDFGEQSGAGGHSANPRDLNALQRRPGRSPANGLRCSTESQEDWRGIGGWSRRRQSLARTARFWRIFERHCRHMPPAIDRMKRGLCHGDLHRSNILLG